MVLLNEVALGDISRIQHDNSSLKKPPKGFHSVLAEGWMMPNPKYDYLEYLFSPSLHSFLFLFLIPSLSLTLSLCFFPPSPHPLSPSICPSPPFPLLSSLKKAPKGFQSVLAEGWMMPDPKHDYLEYLSLCFFPPSPHPLSPSICPSPPFLSSLHSKKRPKASSRSLQRGG